MMLWQRMEETCQVLELQTASDGMGGFESEWNAAKEEQAAIIQNSTTEDSNSGKAETLATYTITSETAMPYGTVIRRVKDGQKIRITSNPQDSPTPEAATFKFYQMRGEEIRLEDE